MTESIKTFWRNNGTIIVILLGYAVGAVIGFSNISSRLGTIEDRGSPTLQNADKRIERIETRQLDVIERLRRLEDMLHNHELNQQKNSPG